MNGKLKLLAILTMILTLLFIIFSCKEKTILEEVTEGNSNLLNKLDCSQRVITVWKHDHYESVSNKTLGFWYNSQLTNIDSMHTKCGFSKIYTSGSNVDFVLNNGFDSTDILVGISRNNIFSYPSGFSQYYIDEPAEERTGHPRIPLVDAMLLAEELYPSKLFAGSYKLGITDNNNVQSYYTNLINVTHQNAYIMCDSYYGLHALPCGKTQTDYWRDYHNAYPYRNTSNWISLLIDGRQDDFKKLFDEADNLHPQMNELWLFIGNTPEGYCSSAETLTKTKFNKYLKMFMETAHSHGWIKSIEKKYYYVYHCTLSNPCEFCDQEDMLSPGWNLEEIIPTTQYREEL